MARSGRASAHDEHGADGKRPDWDDRFYLVESQPRQPSLLRSDSPGSGHEASPPQGDGIVRRSSASAADEGAGRTLVLPGLASNSAATSRPAYTSAPNATLQSPARESAAGAAAAVRAPRTDLMTSYVGMAYWPAVVCNHDPIADPPQGGEPGASGAGGEGGDGSARASGTGDSPAAEDKGGVDGQGTHLPPLALDRAYRYKQPAPPAQNNRGGPNKGARHSQNGKPRATRHPALAGVALPPGSVYLPAKKPARRSVQGSSMQ